MGRYKPVCSSCGGVSIRLDRYDAYVCKACDLWLEQPCDDSGCRFCRGRDGLDRPSRAPAEVWTDSGTS